MIAVREKLASDRGLELSFAAAKKRHDSPRFTIQEWEASVIFLKESYV
jgi:hypothetical protein